MSDNSASTTGWSAGGKTIIAAVVTSVIVYLQITFFTLSASYMMNRSIYRSWAIRVMLGILAGLTAVVTFWVVLFLPKTHYFGMFPVLTDENGGKWGWLNYFRSSYNPARDAGIVEELVRTSLGWRKEMRGKQEMWVNRSGAKPVEYSVGGGGVPDLSSVVDEVKMEKAREAGEKATLEAWKAALRDIGGGVESANTTEQLSAEED
jgi:hypothetical protein